MWDTYSTSAYIPPNKNKTRVRDTTIRQIELSPQTILIARLPAPFLLSLSLKSNIISETSLSLSQQKAQLRCWGFHPVSDRWVTVVVTLIPTPTPTHLRRREALKAIEDLRRRKTNK